MKNDIVFDDATPQLSRNTNFCETVSQNVGSDEPQPQAAKHAVPVNPPPAESSIAARLKNKKVREKGTAKSSKVQTTVPVRTPDKQWFFRAHRDPAMSLPIDILEIRGGEDEGVWFLDPDVQLPDELDQYIIPAIITRCITSDNIEFFYLAKQSSRSPKESTRYCLNEAKKNWVKQNWSATAKGYQIQYANQLHREPVWSDYSLDDLLAKALGEKLICDPTHAVVKRLLDPEDDEVEE
jgi:hypothetical protein